MLSFLRKKEVADGKTEIPSACTVLDMDAELPEDELTWCTTIPVSEYGQERMEQALTTMRNYAKNNR